MGLDMYLYADEYISGYDHLRPEEQERYRGILGACGVKPEWIDTDSPHIHVTYTVGYWRKANAIHRWFVDHVQGGVDECQRSYVSREDLAELRRVAAEAYAAYRAGRPDRAGELLPPRSGFFFGPTALDEWYAEGVKRTVEIVDRVLNTPAFAAGRVSLHYQSSW